MVSWLIKNINPYFPPKLVSAIKELMKLYQTEEGFIIKV